MAVQVDFKPEALERIARSMGHNGNMSKFPAFLASDPAKQHLMERYKKYAGGMIMKAAEGALVKVGKYWHTENADGSTTNTGHRNQGQANIVADAQATIANSTAKSTGQMVDTGKFWSVVMDDGSLVNTGKTKIAQAKSFVGGIEQKTPAPVAPVEYGPAIPDDYVTPASDNSNVASGPVTSDLGSMTTDMVTNPTAYTPQVVAENIQYNENQAIAAGTGEVTGTPTATATTATPATPVVSPAETEAAKIKEVERVKADTETALGQLETKELELDPRAQVTAQEQTESSVSDLDAAQGEATTIDPDTAPKRVVEGDQFVGGEGYSGSEVDMDRVGEVFGTGEVKAASIVSQAIIQAAMASALPIAQIEAGNKQAMALEKARYRAEFMKIDFDQKFQTKVLNAAKVENAANMQFSADQQITLENSRTVNTMNLQNLSNKQSMVLAEASALANLDMANLNNRQQAEVMNAQSFLQVDMANFTNQQQIEMFKAQSRIGALFSDQAAGNAAQQFNASSDNQMTQFFKNMQTQVQQFNVAQQNTMSQFNAGQSNSISQFNTQIQNQRDQFNAQNQLVIAQSNAQWRRQIATADTAATNRANEINAQNALAVSQQAYANLWQERADKLKQAWESAENSAQQAATLALQESKNAADIKIANMAQTGQSIDIISDAIGYLSE